MLFIPKFSKFKKSFRAKPIKRIYKKIDHPTIINGSIGLKILSSGLMSSDQLQAIRQVINKIIKTSTPQTTPNKTNPDHNLFFVSSGLCERS